MSTMIEELGVGVAHPPAEESPQPPELPPPPPPARRPTHGRLVAGITAVLLLGVATAVIPVGAPGHQLWVDATGGAAVTSPAPSSSALGATNPGSTNPGGSVAAPASPQDAAIEQVIQRADDEQVQAIANNDPTVMQDTATPAHYQDLVQTNQGLVSQGVTAIKMANITWGPITINGTTASATSNETWLTTFNDGTTLQSTDTNVYTLMQQGNGWIIQDDQQPNAPSTAGNGSGSLTAPGAPGRSTAPGGASGSTAPGRPGRSTAPGGTGGLTAPGGSGNSTAPAPAEPVPAVPASSTLGTSRNWAGYSASGNGYTGVTGTWIVPEPTSTGSTGIGATWVGIGGVTSHDLIQAGTQDIATAGGQLEWQTWYEMLPAGSQQVPLAVAPGDSVTVSIQEQGAGSGQWQIAFKNNTSGQTYQTAVHYTSSNSSAEWIEEAPATVGGIVPLDSFGNVAFSGASAVRNSQTVNLSQAGARPVTMLNSSHEPLATPSAIGSDGASFNVARTAASSTPTPVYSQGRGFRGN